jgi:hypoxanthine phosphoribosyltransferase
MFTESSIAERVNELAGQIRGDYDGRNPIFVGILKGSFVFLSDLMRRLDMDCQVDFMAASSYGVNTESSGQVRVLKDLGQNIEGRDVIVVEDILDTGLTMDFLVRYLHARKPSSVRICSMLDKPERRRIPIAADYIGFAIPDEFVVGYGLDYADKYRNLPYIGVLKPEIYTCGS